MDTIRHPGVIQELRERIREAGGGRPRSADPGVPTGFAALDRLLPAGGLAPGTLVEWLGDGEGSGAATLGLAVAAHVLRGGAALVVIDDAAEFHPAAAAELGVPLDRTIVVRPADATSALWVWEQSLRCPGVAVTFGRIGSLTDRVARRLQVGAEVGGGWGFLVRPPGHLEGTSWAATRVCVGPVPAAGDPAILGRRVRVCVGRRGSGARAPTAELDLPHETSPLPLAPQLAGPVAVRRSAAG